MKARFAISVLTVLGVWLVACGPVTPKTDGSYHARGMVAAISGSGEEPALSIHHEAITHFKDRDGQPAKMSSMTMIFGLAPAVSLSSVHVGDKIDFDFDVRWSTSPALLLTKLSKLPADTQLTLSDEH